MECCYKVFIMGQHPQKPLYKFTSEELENFTLQYFRKYVHPWELLQSWSKLPKKAVQDFEVQTLLPCYVHFNRPEWRTELEGSAPAQSSCHLCKSALENLKHMSNSVMNS
uniref:Uncharacterized protein LOC114340203 n=1 Tax=Diabrotica virgifera virgifera TaxID=50390 RepID=A0A6P7GLB3_DIAVI